VLAVYFDDKGTVTQIADYGLKDGKVFDFVTKTTPTRGKDDNFLQQVLAGALGGGNPFNK
jgi:outer membrane protein assembly factor BamE (lipoprotein component of BamABCDE complex)